MSAPWLLRLQRGRSPNCSSAGTAVGWALASAVGAGIVINAYADLFVRWARGLPPPGEPAPGGPAPGDTAPGLPAPGEPGPPSGAAAGTAPAIRAEGEGALLAWPDPPALLELDPAAAAAARAAGAREVGAGRPAPPGALSAPTEVHLSVTDRCPSRCEGCYLSAGPDRAGTDPDDLGPVLAELAAAGVFEVAFGGGEALGRADLLRLAGAARGLGLVPNLTTSGLGLREAQLPALAGAFGQINVSIDGPEPVHAELRGAAGAEAALSAVRRLEAAGARVGVNTVMSRPLLERPGALEALGRAIADAGAVEWQWLRFKPAGRGAAAWSRLAPDPADLDALWPRALQLEAETGLGLRWDCALVPFLVQHLDDPAQAARLGVAGCPGGERLLARGADGAWAPCSFALPGSPAALPGSPARGPLEAVWDGDPTLRAWRARAAAPPEPCASCRWSAVCRGGCRVVAAHLRGDPWAADPECPRVREGAA